MSVTIIGVFVAAAGSLLVGFGFTDSCSNEIVAKVLPLLGALPGLVTVYVNRYLKKDVNALGVKK